MKSQCLRTAPGAAGLHLAPSCVEERGLVSTVLLPTQEPFYLASVVRPLPLITLIPTQEAPDLSDLPGGPSCPGCPFSRGRGVASLASDVVQCLFLWSGKQRRTKEYARVNSILAVIPFWHLQVSLIGSQLSCCLTSETETRPQGGLEMVKQ